MHFMLVQPRTSGQVDICVHHIHQLCASSVRASEHHLEHVHEKKGPKLERGHHGVFTPCLRRARHV